MKCKKVNHLISLVSDRTIGQSYLAFIDNSSRGPSRKKRPSQTDNQDEPYVDVKVYF